MSGAYSPVSVEDAKSFEDRSLQRLRSAGYRITMPRVQVIRALADSPVALSAYAIHDKIISSGGKIDVVSVYRILNTLQDVGLIHHIGVVDGYYASRIAESSNGTAQHLVCDSCGLVTELGVATEIVTATEQQAERAKFAPKGIKVEVTGECESCQKAS